MKIRRSNPPLSPRRFPRFDSWAAEISIQKGNGIFEILNLLDEIYGWEFDCGLSCGNKTFAHLKKENHWVYFKYENGYVAALDAITGDVVATKNLPVEEV